MICGGCNTEIHEGLHFMKVRIEIDTRMPPNYKPVVELPPTFVEANVHNPGCLYQWAINNDIFEDVFYR